MNDGVLARVSIIMPTHNRMDLVPRAIESVRKQTFMDWELLVTDDASTDTTWNVLTEWAAKDARIKPHRNATNQYPDISGILNGGIARSQGAYIARLDDDDYWIDSEKLAKQVAYLDAHPECVIVGTGVVVVDAENKERYRYFKKEFDIDIRKSALAANPFTHSTVMYRKSIALAAGGYANRYIEDWALWLAMGTRGSLHNIPEYSIAYLMAESNKTWLFQRAQYREVMKLIWRFKWQYPRFARGFAVNCAAYAFAFLPTVLRRALQGYASRFKRTV
ncbi:MAG: glycosyltransferase [Candidatus Pacebacteria bacterium]|nr:glycosyltransferase [Candidatus Paceibacterota bacterium]